MILSKLMMSIQKPRPYPFQILSLLLLAATPNVWGSTDGWSSQPAWAAGDNLASPPAHRSARSVHSEPKYDNISPFSPGSNNLSLDVGQVFLMGDLGKYNDSIGSQLHYDYGVSDLFAFDSSLGYSSHSDGKFSMTTLLMGLRTNLSWYDKVVPYVIFGLGFYKPSYQQPLVQGPNGNLVDGTGGSISPILFGVHLGPGVDLALTKNLYFGAGLTFHDAFGSSQITQAGLASVGGTFVSFLVHAGVTF